MFIKALQFSFLLLILSAALIVLSACSNNAKKETEGNVPSLTAPSAVPSQTTTVQVTSDGSMEYDAYIILENEKSTLYGDGVTFTDNTLSITKGGTYYLTGTLSDGKIYVNSADEEKKVKLIFASLNVNCTTDAPLYIENSPDETVIILQKDTQNYLSDTSRTVAEGVTDYATAVIYSKDDLQLEGEGSLTVNGNFGKGIFSKNDIDIRGGNISITCVDDGIRGKDSVEIETGVINITSGGDGIRTSEETEADKGNIEIEGGTLNITSSLDAIQATGDITINGGSFTFQTAGGSTENYSYQYQGMQNPPGGNRQNPLGFGNRPDSSIYEEIESDTPSTKGIKSDKSITVNGGSFNLNCLDDTIHAPYVTVSAGDLRLASDDDGIHGDENVTISGGSVVITNSYESIEGRTINIHGGKILAESADDGFNAASSSSSDAYSDGGFRGGMHENDSSCKITMTDGYVLLLAQGDGVDSNGSVELSGGKLIVFGPTGGGNGALDYGGSFTVTGGTLLATGSRGMSQSVSQSSVPVLNVTLDAQEKTLHTIADGNSSCKISFTSPKSFQNLIFASDCLQQGESYSLYRDGSVKGASQSDNGISFDGIYSPGTLIQSLS